MRTREFVGFVMENIYAIILTMILLSPLVLQLHMLILNPKKLCTLFHYYACTTEDNTSRKSSLELLQHYPKEPIIVDVESSSKISLTNLRTVSSSPAVQQVSSITKREKEPSKHVVLSVKHSCTFVKTDEVLPVVDITWNYNSYRYKTFESCLRDLYGDKYPPGEVVLNSMQLNLLDSRTNVSVVNLFDFLKDSEPSLNATVSRKLEIEYLNPLDHFVNKLTDRPSTEERSTETQQEFSDQRRSSDNACEEDSIRSVITLQRIPKEKNTTGNQRSYRKIEPWKCNLSSHKRVHGNDDGKRLSGIRIRGSDNRSLPMKRLGEIGRSEEDARIVLH